MLKVERIPVGTKVYITEVHQCDFYSYWNAYIRENGPIPAIVCSSGFQYYEIDDPWAKGCLSVLAPELLKLEGKEGNREFFFIAIKISFENKEGVSYCPICALAITDTKKSCPVCSFCTSCCSCVTCKKCKSIGDCVCVSCGKCRFCCTCGSCITCAKQRQTICKDCRSCSKHCTCKYYNKLLSNQTACATSDPCSLCLDTRYDFTQAVVSYYVLEEIIHQQYDNRPSRQRLKQDLIYEQQRLERHLALLMRDYLVLASFGEARHVPQESRLGLFRKLRLPPRGHRNKAYQMAHPFDPDTLITGLCLVFHQENWSGGYGGRAWYKCIHTAKEYHKMTNHIFVDHAVDLMHNGGPVYNKPILISYPEYFTEFLDFKRDESLLTKKPRHFVASKVLRISYNIYHMLERAVNLGVISSHGEGWHIVQNPFAYDNPVRWGGVDFVIDRLL